MAVKEPFVHNRTLIAIDPDSEKSGVALIKQGHIESLTSQDLFALMVSAREWKESGFLVLLEDIDNNKPTFKKGQKEKVSNAISRCVGRAQDAARNIRKILERESVEYVLVEPLRIPEKRRAKDDATFFNDLTGWEGRTNQDKRDAALLGLYGLPNNYKTCDVNHVFTGGVCRTCAMQENKKRAQKARRDMKKKKKEALKNA
jgi:hypothetical protein